MQHATYRFRRADSVQQTARDRQTAYNVAKSAKKDSMISSSESDILQQVHLARHDIEELGEIDHAVAVSVDLVDHVLKLGLGRKLAERAHHSADKLGFDGAVAILVEVAESLHDLCEQFLCQTIRLQELGHDDIVCDYAATSHICPVW
jgi:hypothetical protein